MHEYAAICLRGVPGFRGEAEALPATARCSKVSRYRLTRSFSESPHSYLDSYSTGVKCKKTGFTAKM